MSPDDAGGVVVNVPPLRTVVMFATVVLFALNVARSERIDWTCALVRPVDGAVMVRKTPLLDTLLVFSPTLMTGVPGVNPDGMTKVRDELVYEVGLMDMISGTKT